MYETDLEMLKRHFIKMFPMDAKQTFDYRNKAYSHREGRMVARALLMKNFYRVTHGLDIIHDENTEHFKIQEHLQERLRGAVRSMAGSGQQKDLFATDEGCYMDMFSCTIRQFREHFEKLFKDGMAWQNHGKWHVDHIKPCVLFDLNYPEQRKECFNLTNLQPLWALENKDKGASFKEESVDLSEGEIEAIYKQLFVLCGEV